MTTALRLQPVSGRIGVEVLDADIDDLLANGPATAELREALLEHLVVVLRGLAPTPEQHLALGRIFGEIEPPEAYNPQHPDHPGICVFDSEGGYKADGWHADVTWKDVIPLGAVLCMRINPPTGGDTVWTNCHAAYDDLSNGMKKLLVGRRAHHDISPEHFVEHPVVVTHPETGRKLLFVNEIFTRRITNLPPAESAAILPFLIRHLSRPEFTYRHRWQVGDVVIWDNRATQHYALFDFDGRRLVHRVGIAGGRPSA
ncbi:MAG: TauD/TfdA family dioxygenase [Acidimicrobiales bacterium]|nr:TauD/TfdA family dioxygenase [Acidimicrobiales bacterium]